jgi:hypothetical protein
MKEVLSHGDLVGGAGGLHMCVLGGKKGGFFCEFLPFLNEC